MRAMVGTLYVQLCHMVPPGKVTGALPCGTSRHSCRTLASNMDKGLQPSIIHAYWNAAAVTSASRNCSSGGLLAVQHHASSSAGMYTCAPEALKTSDISFIPASAAASASRPWLYRCTRDTRSAQHHRIVRTQGDKSQSSLTQSGKATGFYDTDHDVVCRQFERDVVTQLVL